MLRHAEAAPSCATVRPAMAFVNGLLALGTALSGAAVVEPPSGTGYVRQPISYDLVSGGIAVNSVNAVFGPSLGASGSFPWGTLSVFGVMDPDGNPVWAGTLSVPVTPQAGSLVYVPEGSTQLNVGSQPTAYNQGVFVSGIPVPPVTGALTSGSAVLASSGYMQVVPSGAYGAMVIQAATRTESVNLIFGGASLPSPNASGFFQLLPGQSWPPPGMDNFVPEGPVWAMASTSGTLLNWLLG